MKQNFCRDENRKKGALTFRNLHKAVKKDDYCCQFPFKLFHELQKIDYKEKNLNELFYNFSTTSKTQLDMCFPQTTSQQAERRAFQNWKSRRVENCIKKRHKQFAKLLNNQIETN